ncbi:MAG: YdcF family protein [Acutalibacteraceae bacterium]|nr:YdcF family protein [Acutalibacteraceae bacterium]
MEVSTISNGYENENGNKNNNENKKIKKLTIAYNIFRAFMVVIACIFLVWFILPYIVYNILNAFNLMGIFACLFVIAFYGARPLLKKLREKLYQKRITKILWKTGRFLIYTFISYSFIVSVIMAICANIPPIENASEIMLGAQVKGTQPTLSLYDRITAGREFLEENPESICVATGGLGNTAEITEAQCMYNVLTSEGIDSDRIYLENHAVNTKENIEFSYEIIQENDKNKNIAIVSDGFHQARARLIARKLGITSHIGAVSANTNWIYMPTFWVREWFAIPYDLFFR